MGEVGGGGQESQGETENPILLVRGLRAMEH